MEIHQLRYFLAVSDERSFSRAAERVRVSQPSLSQQIQKLEAEVGRPLFDRLSRQVTLTEAGHGLLPHARKILSQLHDAHQFLKDFQDEPGGSVRLGIIPTVAPYILPPLLEAVKQKFPQLTLGIVEQVTEGLIRANADGEIDLAIISTCRPHPGIWLESCLQEPLFLAVSEMHPLAAQAQVRWQQLRSQSMLLLHDSHCLSDQIRRWCAQHQIPTREDLPTLQLSSLLALVAAGRGVSLVPAMALPHEQGQRCAFLSFQASVPHREINVLRNPARYQSKAVAALGLTIRQILCERAQTPPSNVPERR